MSLDESRGSNIKVVHDRSGQAAAARRMAKTDWECQFCHRHMTLNSKGNHLKYCKLNPDRARTFKKGSKRSDLIPCEYCTKGISPDAMRHHVSNSCYVAKAIRDGRVVVPQPTVKIGSAQLDTGKVVTVETFDPPITVGEGDQLGWVVDAAGTGRLSINDPSTQHVPMVHLEKAFADSLPPIDKSITEERERRTREQLTTQLSEARQSATEKLEVQRTLVQSILEVAIDEILNDQFDGELTFSMANRIGAGLVALVDVLLKELPRP